MYNLRVIITLILHTFSFRKDSLRFVSFRRIFAVILVYPLFTVTFIINWFFLLLDEIIFHSYRKQKVEKAVFIIGVPRSATTYLFNLLFCDTASFHGFKLWELIFAPSVCQKYIFLFLKWIDDMIGNPLYRLSFVIDKLVFGDFRLIHEMGLSMPEEDEVLFLYNFSSLFLYYFYPELPQLDNFLYHDTKVPQAVRKRNIRFYYSCVQRHNYVYNRDNSKYFISKSPTFIPKMESIALMFEDAKFIYPLRSPYSTIPSSISLNQHIFSNFCRLPRENHLIEASRDFLINWYIHADKVLKMTIKERGKTIYYDDIVNYPEGVVKQIYNFLQLEPKPGNSLIEKAGSKQGSYKSRHIYDTELGVDSKIINERLGNILPPELLIKK